jgi:hypothetical protein
MNRRVALACLPLVSFSPVLRAQSTNASLTGRITDPSKAAIAEARVSAISTDTNVRYETTTNGSGYYYLLNLPPGTYRLKIEKPGFKQIIKPDVILHVQDALSVDFEMTVGDLTESITVKAPCVFAGLRVGGGQHAGGPHLCRGHSPQWQEFPDTDPAHAWRGGDRNDFR